MSSMGAMLSLMKMAVYQLMKCMSPPELSAVPQFKFSTPSSRDFLIVATKVTKIRFGEVTAESSTTSKY